MLETRKQLESDNLEVSQESLNKFLEKFPHTRKNIEYMIREGMIVVRTRED